MGIKVRVVGESADAARALGLPVDRIRILSTAQGGFLAGIGGSYLSLYYPFNWSEGLSSGQGLMAVALVIFARWHPVGCLWVSLLWGGAAALDPRCNRSGSRRVLHLQRNPLHHDLGGDDYNLFSQTQARRSTA